MRNDGYHTLERLCVQRANREQNNASARPAIKGKTIIPFCTSGSSGISTAISEIRGLESNATVKDGRRFEKVGDLPQSIPTNDENITTQAGDLILYQGKSFVIYYDTNTWSFTRLGKINNVSQAELKEILAAGNVTAVLSLSGASPNSWFSHLDFVEPAPARQIMRACLPSLTRSLAFEVPGTETSNEWLEPVNAESYKGLK